jgi:hypothetical protein
VPKTKVNMDQILTAREHQEPRDELEMDDEHDTSDICRMCQIQLMRAAVDIVTSS